METLMRELIDTIKASNMSFDWAATISAICSVISLVAIIILLKERSEKQRPYLQATFELIRDGLVCIIIRNVGEVPAKLVGITFSDDFVIQLNEQAQKCIHQASKSNLSIYPKQQWVICLATMTFDVLKLDNLLLRIELSYSAFNKPRKIYKHRDDINFNDYRGFMVYISETDELKREVKNMSETLKKMSDLLKRHYKISEPTVKTQAYWNTEDDTTRKIVTALNSSEPEEK